MNALAKRYRKKKYPYGGDMYGDTALQEIPEELQIQEEMKRRALENKLVPGDPTLQRQVLNPELTRTPRGNFPETLSGPGGNAGVNIASNLAGRIQTPKGSGFGKLQGSTGLAGAGIVAAGGAEVMETVGKGDPLTGRRTVGHYAGKGALKGLAMGASTGNPYLAIAGAVVGGVSGLLKGGKEKRRVNKEYAQSALEKRAFESDSMRKAFASDPNLISGYKGSNYYATGGKLSAKYYANGGQLVKRSSDGVEVVGPSHENGGVTLPGNNEVEGGETIKKGAYGAPDFVYSEQLGFAKEHKKIMRAKGIIEKKPATKERMAAINQLEKQENFLAAKQEYLKKKFGIK